MGARATYSLGCLRVRVTCDLPWRRREEQPAAGRKRQKKKKERLVKWHFGDKMVQTHSHAFLFPFWERVYMHTAFRVKYRLALEPAVCIFNDFVNHSACDEVSFITNIRANSSFQGGT